MPYIEKLHRELGFGLGQDFQRLFDHRIILVQYAVIAFISIRSAGLTKP